ncbi:MAG: relaxase [Pseudomonadota bacterium]
MILVGSQRGGGADLTRHLMKAENERVVVHEVRGFVSTDLAGAFQESYAISRGTRCKQHLYSLSLNPPLEAEATAELLLDAVDRAEERLGLTGQPRAIAFHDKRGTDGQLRRHAHAVWCRIDADRMRAVQMSFDRPKLQAVARALYLDHGWTMPRGFVRHEERNPRNYSLAEWQQAKRAKKDPAKLKAMFQDCWAISDSQVSFAHALRENGYILARGDRRGVVAVDHQGEVYAIRQYVGIPSKSVRERIPDMERLPTVAHAHHEAAQLVADRLRELEAEQKREALRTLRHLADQRRRAQLAQRDATVRALQRQRERREREAHEREARLKSGWRGLIQRITGKRRWIEAENEAAAERTVQRDLTEHKALIDRHRSIRQAVLARAKAEKNARRTVLDDLQSDIRRVETPKPAPEEARDAARIRRRGRDVPRRKSRSCLRGLARHRIRRGRERSQSDAPQHG